MHVLQSPPGATVQIDGREYLYFVGTGYLGLQGRPEVIRAACEAAERYGISSANSRTAFGTTPPLLEVERRAAALFGMDDAFYYASGWMGNNILVQLLANTNGGVVFVDEFAHYSLFEAARWTNRPCVTFRHLDANDLHAQLKQHLAPGQMPLTMSDGVFPATGHIAPIREYCERLQEYPGSTLCLDDAHAVAVLGENGRGTFEYAGLWPAVSPLPLGEGPGVRAAGSGQWPVASGRCNAASSESNPQSLIPNPSSPPCPALLFSATLSKAVGGFGGIIPGSGEFIRCLKSQSAYFGGASPPPPPIAAATAQAIELVMAEPELRTRLWSNVRILKDGLRSLGFAVDQTPVPIISLTIGTAENMQRIQRELMTRGVAIAYMAAYSGLGVEGALRIAVFATHTESMVQRLLDELRNLV